jgi:hypothetical protein
MKKKETQYGHDKGGNNNNGYRDRENYDSQDEVLQLPPKMRSSRKISGFMTVEIVRISAFLLREMCLKL